MGRAVVSKSDSAKLDEILARIGGLETEVRQGFARMDRRFDRIEKRVQGVETAVDDLTDRVDGLGVRVNGGSWPSRGEKTAVNA